MLCALISNSAERALQVAQMGQIYRNARKVCIWLCKEGPCTFSVIQAIREKDMDYLRYAQYCGLGYAQVPDGLIDLLSSLRWMRLWVVQELALAAGDPVITILHGVLLSK